MFKPNAKLIKWWLAFIAITIFVLDLFFNGYAPCGGCSSLGKGERFTDAKIHFLLEKFPVLKKDMVLEILDFRCAYWIDFSLAATVKVHPDNGALILEHAEHLYGKVKNSKNDDHFYKNNERYKKIELDRLHAEIKNMQNNLYAEIRRNGDTISPFNAGNSLDLIIDKYRRTNQHEMTVAKADIYKKKLSEYAILLEVSQKYNHIQFNLPHPTHDYQSFDFLMTTDDTQKDWTITFGLNDM